MTKRALGGEHRLLRIHIGESDRAGKERLADLVVRKAREAGLAGCTLLRGIAGFGHGRIHSNLLVEVESSLPVIIEVVDSKERLDRFLAAIEPSLGATLVTEERAHVRRYTEGTE